MPLNSLHAEAWAEPAHAEIMDELTEGGAPLPTLLATQLLIVTPGRGRDLVGRHGALSRIGLWIE
jgi:hypothetical protein